MFEAFILICALGVGVPPGGGDTPCREMLLPGYGSASVEPCQAALAARPSPWQVVPGTGAVSCNHAAASSLVFREIAPGVHVHEGRVSVPDPSSGGDLSNIGFVIGARSVAVIDAGGSRRVGEEVYRAIRQLTDLPISHLVLTHLHPDHLLGAEVFVEAGATVIGHERLPRALAERVETYTTTFRRSLGEEVFLGSRILSPELIVPASPGMTLDLGNRVLDLLPQETGHSLADLVVVDPATGTAFLGDVLFDRHLPVVDGSLKGWLRGLEALAFRPFARVVPGHGALSLSWPEAAAPLRRYLEALEQETRAALAAGETLSAAASHAGREAGESWELFEAYGSRNATAAYTELEWE